MRRFLTILTILIIPVSAAAQGPSVTVRDIVELTKAGLGDEALVALIEVNRPVFPVDVDTLKGLKDSGVSAPVIVAMIRSGRAAPPPAPAQAAVELPPAHDVLEVQAPPPVVVIEHHERVREVPVAVPVYVAVPSRRVISTHPSRASVVRRKPKPAEPVFWGWGGKLRPDAWKPTAADVQKDAKVPLLPQRK